METFGIYVRLIKDKKNKRKFETRFFEHFSKPKSLTELKEQFVSLFGNEFHGGCSHGIDVGYIGYSNKKVKITSDDDVAKAFQNGLGHSVKHPVFFMVETEQESDSELRTQGIGG